MKKDKRMIPYSITNKSLTQIATYYRLLERFVMLPEDSAWMQKLRETASQKKAFAAVAIGRNLTAMPLTAQEYSLSQLRQEIQSLPEYEHYLELMGRLNHGEGLPQHLSVEAIEWLYEHLFGLKGAPGTYQFRTKEGVVDKVIWEHGIKKVVSLKIQTPIDQIERELQVFSQWFSHSREAVHPLILAAIAHLVIAQIHPYPDGNGRLSRVIVKFVMHLMGERNFLFLSPEYVYYLYREQYFEVLGKALNQLDATVWIEFYTKCLLESVHLAFEDLRQISAGAVDLARCSIIELTDREEHFLHLMSQKQQASAAELANLEGVSRQNVNVILKRLVSKNLLSVVGEGTHSRYMIKGV
jgi:Fic family protein